MAPPPPPPPPPSSSCGSSLSSSGVFSYRPSRGTDGTSVRWGDMPSPPSGCFSTGEGGGGSSGRGPPPFPFPSPPFPGPPGWNVPLSFPSSSSLCLPSGGAGLCGGTEEGTPPYGGLPPPSFSPPSPLERRCHPPAHYYTHPQYAAVLPSVPLPMADGWMSTMCQEVPSWALPPMEACTFSALLTNIPMLSFWYEMKWRLGDLGVMVRQEGSGMEDKGGTEGGGAIPPLSSSSSSVLCVFFFACFRLL